MENTLRIMKAVSDYVQHNYYYPNVLILGLGLHEEMCKNYNPVTLLSELERLKGMANIDGTPVFKIIARSNDITGYMVTRI